MKSSPSLLTPSQRQSISTWVPSDLGAGDNLLETDFQIEQIQALFRGETQPAARKESGSRSALFAADGAHTFNAWQPGEVSGKTPVVRKPDWVFIESVQASLEEETQAASVESEPQAARETPRVDLAKVEAEAALILERARQQAEEMIVSAQVEADEILAQVQEEIDEQKKDGYRQGWEEARREVEDAMKATRVMVEEVRVWKSDLFAQGEQILVSMLKEIAQKMFGEGVDLDTNALQLNLNRIMESAQGLGDLNIFINPRDARVLDPSWSEYQMLITGEQVKIIPSGKITRGGCYVKGNMGTVDGRVETQLNAILKTFDEAGE